MTRKEMIPILIPSARPTRHLDESAAEGHHEEPDIACDPLCSSSETAR